MNVRARRFTAWSIAPLVIGLVGCGNIFENLSAQNTNDAYFADARAAMNARDFTTALTKLLATSTDFQSRRDVTLTIASAYAGRCGLDLLNLTQAIANAPASTRLFPLLLANFKGSTTGSIADCGQAQAWVLKLAPSYTFSYLNPDEALFLAVASIAKIGAILGTYADLNQDGSVDAGFDACNTTMLPDAERRDIGAAVNLTLAGLNASGNTQIAGSTAGVASVCTSLPAGQNFCGIYDPTAFTAQMDQVLGGLIGSQDSVGLGSCANTLPNCVCH